ncbi:MAG: FprA family A-type flavoprotein [bacterium]
MNKAYKIREDFHWVGVIDWNLRDFHGYSTEKGSTYNAYLLKDEKVVLFDTVKSPFSEELMERISSVIAPEKIDYIVVNHVEMDHSSSLPLIIDRIKPEKIICSAKGKEALISHFKRTDWPYHVVKTGDVVNIGKRNISFLETPMLHWPDSMCSYIPEEKILISNDILGQHFATSERFDTEVDFSELMCQNKKYFANIIMPYSPLVQKLLKTITDMKLDIQMIAPDHGLIWTKHIPDALKAYYEWSSPKLEKKAVVFYDTMWRSTEKMAYSVTEGIRSQGVSVKMMKLGDDNHRSDIMTEILDAGAVVVGSSTLNNEMLPHVADMLTYMKGLKPVNRIGAALSSYGWNPGVLKKLNTELEASGVKLISEGITVKYVPEQSDIENCYNLGVKIAQELNTK